MWKLFVAAFALLAPSCWAQSVTPNFTQGSMTSTTTASQTINETLQTQVFGGAYRNVSATNVTASGDINAVGSTWSVTDATKPYSFELTTRAAGLVEQTDITRTITTTSTINSLSVFSQ